MDCFDTALASKMLRRDFLNADVGISGGNFIIAETGSLGLVMNEGNGRMCTTMPNVHIALVGIEKVIENLEDYATLDQVLTRSGTGQNLTVYTNIINGPSRESEVDGPDDVQREPEPDPSPTRFFVCRETLWYV